MEIRLAVDTIRTVPIGAVGKAFGFSFHTFEDSSPNEGTTYLDCIFYGYPGEYRLGVWEVESLS